MKKTSLPLLTGLITGVIGVMSAQFEINAQVTIQKKSDVVVTSSTNPWAYLVVEGESYASEANDTAGFGFVKVFNDGAITSFRGNPILGTNSSASGNGALFTQSPNFGEHSDKATYQVQFATAGTYYIYMRFTMFENGSNLAHYISEDSFFVPPGFNLDPQLDWPLPRGGYAEGCCDTSGFLSIASPGSEGVRTAYRDGSFSNYWEGNFHWNEVKSSQFNNPATQGEPNLRFTYTVTPEMLGTPQNFTISYREGGTTIDLFLFSTHTNLMDQYTQDELDALLVKKVTVQDPSNVVGTGPNAWSYLVMEGESYVSEANDTAGFGFVQARGDGGITSFRGNPVLGANTTASKKGALFTQTPLFGEHADKATYQVQFYRLA